MHVPFQCTFADTLDFLHSNDYKRQSNRVVTLTPCKTLMPKRHMTACLLRYVFLLLVTLVDLDQYHVATVVVYWLVTLDVFFSLQDAFRCTRYAAVKVCFIFYILMDFL